VKPTKVQRRLELMTAARLSPNRFKFEPAQYPPENIDYRAFMAAPWNLSEQDARDTASRMAREWVLRSDTYQVAMIDWPCLPLNVVLTHLSIKRIDREPLHDWRELQMIKNALCGPEREGVEVYPAESRLVDTANQFHMWVLPEGRQWPFGWDTRMVTEDEPGKVKQRPF
jgi:hypothetical protein